MLAIIGGTGLSELEGFEQLSFEMVKTPFAADKVKVGRCSSEQQEFLFLPRHGCKHQIPPHKVNYRANIWALSELGVKEIVAVNAVGGIHNDLPPGSFAVPDQLIDYCYGRDSTFFEDGLEQVSHIDFTHPYSENIRQHILQAAHLVNKRQGSHQAIMEGGTYACTQGPRLETAAEVRRLQQDGCDMVGMTGMPEAALARELNIDYASFALSVNWGAGLSDELITLDEIHVVLQSSIGFVMDVLKEIIGPTSSR
jgi:5'-deoxy-5'-methylthioadenosine phosphorylase